MQLIAGSTISHLYVQCIKILTICLRAIRNAWHFCYALRFVFKVACVSFGIQLLT
ncbi:TPA: DUF3265 domain-containing protein, partial [Vibrio parahaemolyticus]|nr:DUF3265 domain-containing protein [Vibrio parahaemolyticus]HCG9001445.1 DUF3265 domain-containing protein [Vibrio parahaemolyticus]